jgi:hypothetical protein
MFNLKTLREALADRSPTVLAQRTGLSRRTVHRFLRGEMITLASFEALKKYAISTHSKAPPPRQGPAPLKALSPLPRRDNVRRGDLP